MSASTPPGWYQDPSNPSAMRWWDGAQWTAHVSAPAAAPPQTAAPAAPAASPAAAPATVLNVWIWLVVLLPYVTLPLLFLIRVPPLPTASQVDDPGFMIEWQLQFVLNPAYLAMIVLSWVALAVVVFAAYRDWRWLQAAGVERPFHWAFVFLNLLVGPVYAIGRAVVTRRRTGQGSIVLWVTIGLLVLAFVIVILWGVLLIADLVTGFAGLIA